MIKSLFISKASVEVDKLQSFCDEKGIDLTAESLIQFEALSFSNKASFDVVFFGSKRAVQFYIEGNGVFAGKQIACVGEQTANELKQKGITVDFVGVGSDVFQISNDFKNWLGPRVALFPQSNKSLRTIQGTLDEEQVVDLICYNTILKNLKIKEVEYYVFTSPSNAESYFDTNKLPENCTVISWGSSTLRYLNDFGTASTKLPSPDIDTLIELLKDEFIFE